VDASNGALTTVMFACQFLVFEGAQEKHPPKVKYSARGFIVLQNR
jgi:hypothetical protein